MNPFARIRSRYWGLRRRLLHRRLRGRLTNRDLSILCSNCVGGVMLHELGLRFDSPTVNLFMTPSDFVKFLERLDDYLKREPRKLQAEEPYPVGMLGDVRLDFMHYESFDAAKAKWEERKARIHFDNLYLILVERDGCSEETLRRFDALPYPHKLCFTARERPELACAVHIPGSEEGGQVRDLTAYRDERRYRRWIDEFDFVSFLNQK